MLIVVSFGCVDDAAAQNRFGNQLTNRTLTAADFAFSYNRGDVVVDRQLARFDPGWFFDDSGGESAA